MDNITYKKEYKDKKIKELKKLKNILIGTTDDILDDGRDLGDCEQNSRFVNEYQKISYVGKQLAFFEFEGISESDLDYLWWLGWGDYDDRTASEVKYNHHIRYIDYLIERIEKLKNGGLEK